MSLFTLFGLDGKDQTVEFGTHYEPRDSDSSDDGEDSDVEDTVAVIVYDKANTRVITQGILSKTRTQSKFDKREYTVRLRHHSLNKATLSDDALIDLIKDRLSTIGPAFAFQILQLFTPAALVNFMLSAGLDIHSFLPSPVEGKSVFK